MSRHASHPGKIDDIYLDGNATTRVLPTAVDAALHAMRANFGNPSSPHDAGHHARLLTKSARELCASYLGVHPTELVFTSGATESIQTAVLSALVASKPHAATRPLVLFSATEHAAVHASLRHWNQLLGDRFEVRALAVDASGHLDLRQLAELLPQASLLATMAANNETGVITNLGAIAELLDNCAQRPLWLVDCVQALGKFAVDLHGYRIDYAAFSGHKIHAPKGIGMLFTRENAPLTPLIQGGGQEAGQRGGTENMPGIAALARVVQELVTPTLFTPLEKLPVLREKLCRAVREAFPDAVFHGASEQSLPTVLNFHVPDRSSQELVEAFDAAHLQVATGSACSSNKSQGSTVLAAMGYSTQICCNSIRLSFDRLTSIEEIEEACRRLIRVGQVLRSEASSNSQGLQLREGVSLTMRKSTNDAWIEISTPSRQFQIGCDQPRGALPKRTDDRLTYTELEQRLAAGGLPDDAWRPGSPELLEIVGQCVDLVSSFYLSDSLFLVAYAKRNDGGCGYMLAEQHGTTLRFLLVAHEQIAASRQLAEELARACQTANRRIDSTTSLPLCCQQTIEHQTLAAAYQDIVDGAEQSYEAQSIEAFTEACSTKPHRCLLLDVRESQEHQLAGLSGELHGKFQATRLQITCIPLSELAAWLITSASQLRDFQQIRTMCRSGVRAQRAAQTLATLHPDVAVLPDAACVYRMLRDVELRPTDC